MCNLYSNTLPRDAMVSLFDIKAGNDLVGNAPPLKAIYPRGSAPVVRGGKCGERVLTEMHWGFLLPQVSKRTGKPIMPKAVNNARDDKVRASRFWRESFEKRRCLVPATAFCEMKGRRPAKYFWFGVRCDSGSEAFAFAGIWRSFRGQYRGEAVALQTYSVLTTTPNELTADVHPDRMPVILRRRDYDPWLSGSEDDAFALLRPFPAQSMLIIDSGEDLKSDPRAA